MKELVFCFFVPLATVRTALCEVEFMCVWSAVDVGGNAIESLPSGLDSTV
jgi:hypothetical protein